MYGIGFYGSIGSGKTYTLTLVGYYLKHKYPNSEVYANYHVQFAKPITIDDIIHWITSNPRNRNLKIVMFDEIQRFIPRISPSSTVNRIFRLLFQNLRKHNILLLYTSQSPSYVDKDLVENYTYYFFMMYKGNRYAQYYKTGWLRADVIVKGEYGYVLSNNIYIQFHPKIYNMYDTLEVITPMDIELAKVKFKKRLKEVFKENP